MNQLKFNDGKFFLQSTKSPHFPCSGKIGQLIKKKRVLCWSIYIISLWSDWSGRLTLGHDVWVEPGLPPERLNLTTAACFAQHMDKSAILKTNLKK